MTTEILLVMFIVLAFIVLLLIGYIFLRLPLKITDEIIKKIDSNNDFNAKLEDLGKEDAENEF